MLGFSTLGCPSLPLPEVAALADRHGIPMVELRCAADEPVHVGLDKAQRQEVLADLNGLRIGALASYYRLCDDEPDTLAAHVELAKDLNVPAIRIFPGRSPETSIELAAERLATVSKIAGDVTLLLETHDLLLRGSEIAAVLAGCGAENVGAIWDIMHTWRAGETPAEAEDALGPWLHEVQIKDAASAEDRRPLVPGSGSVPIKESLDTLDGFAGSVVLEHETKWYADAAPFEKSLAAFVQLIRDHPADIGT